MSVFVLRTTCARGYPFEDCTRTPADCAFTNLALRGELAVLDVAVDRRAAQAAKFHHGFHAQERVSIRRVVRLGMSLATVLGRGG